MRKTVSQFATELADREAIRDCMARYARGGDRWDRALLDSVFWPDATDDHMGFFKGSALGFLDHVEKNTTDDLESSAHLLGLPWIEIKCDFAVCETYVHAYHRIRSNGPRDVILGARYVDRFERRNDEWRIIERLVVPDWVREYPDTWNWSKNFLGCNAAAIRPVRSKPNDASYRLLERQETLVRVP